MGLIHAAYTFDAVSFHRELEAKLVVNDELRLNVLHDMAASIAAHLTGTVEEVLELLRFDPEWLDSQEEDACYSAEWYMIVLTSKLAPVPSLSHRCQASHLTLDYALSALGWSKEEIRLLKYGQYLNTLLETSGNPLFVAEFVGVSQRGGWLSREVISQLLSHLLLVKDFFPSPLLEARKEITDLAGWWSRTPAELLCQGYADARDMLETALTRNQPVYLSLFD